MDHKKLDVWKKSMDLVENVYGFTAKFPEEERYGLTSQMRRAAVSISSNIAEGTARKGKRELLQFISIALRSVAELETQYEISVRLNFVKKFEGTFRLMTDVEKLLLKFRNYILKKQ